MFQKSHKIIPFYIDSCCKSIHLLFAFWRNDATLVKFCLIASYKSQVTGETVTGETLHRFTPHKSTLIIIWFNFVVFSQVYVCSNIINTKNDISDTSKNQFLMVTGETDGKALFKYSTFNESLQHRCASSAERIPEINYATHIYLYKPVFMNIITLEFNLFCFWNLVTGETGETVFLRKMLGLH